MATRILIVEDEAVTAADLEEELTAQGYEVVASCDTGEEAMKAAETLAPELVIMDINLAGAMDGITTSCMMRGHLELPVVFLTAHCDDKTLQRAKLTGPFGYVLKPFQPRELRIVIEIALYKHAIENDRVRLIRELQEALDHVETLQALLPICASCKKVRDDQGYWQQIEGYLSEHAHLRFTHGLCPACAREMVESARTIARL